MNRVLKSLTIYGIIFALTLVFNTGFASNGHITASHVYSGALLISEASSQDYTDIAGHWAEKTLRALISKGLIKGVDVGGRLAIQPDRQITRAEFLAVLMRANSYTVVTDKVRSFNDVDAKAWFKDAVDKAVSNGIVAGYPDGSFKPNSPIKRAEMAELIAKIGGWKTQEMLDKVHSIAPFKDVGESKWYFVGVMINKLKGTIGGYPDGTCKPENNATRAEAMTIFSKYLDIVNPASVTPQDATPTPVSTPTPTSTATPTPTPASDKTPLPTQTPQAVLPDTDPSVMCFDVKGRLESPVFFRVYTYALKELGKFDFKITYDASKVVAVSVNDGSIKPSGSIRANLSNASTGTITVGTDDTSPILHDGGTLFTVMFNIVPGATGSTEVVLSGLNGSTPELYKYNGDRISHVNSSNGTITIKN